MNSMEKSIANDILDDILDGHCPKDVGFNGLRNLMEIRVDAICGCPRCEHEREIWAKSDAPDVFDLIFP